MTPQGLKTFKLASPKPVQLPKAPLEHQQIVRAPVIPQSFSQPSVTSFKLKVSSFYLNLKKLTILLLWI